MKQNRHFPAGKKGKKKNTTQTNNFTAVRKTARLKSGRL